MKTNAERDLAIKKLRETLHPGTVLYILLRHESRNRTCQWIEFYHISENRLVRITWDATQAIGGTYCRSHDALRVASSGMSAGFRAAYALGEALHGDGYALRHHWL